MDSCLWFATLSVLPLLLVVKLSLSDVREISVYLSVNKGQRPQNLSLLANVSLTQSRYDCIRQCAVNEFCGSGIYSVGTGSCTLIAEFRSEVTLIADDDSYYFSKRPCRVGFELYYRTDWQALPPVGTPGALAVPVSFVVLHASTIVRDNLWPDDCGDLENCFQTMRAMQYYDMYNRSKTWWDIGVNFFLDASGRFYEGRSWTRNAAYLSVTSRGGVEGYGMHVAITIFGDFHTVEPSRKAQMALRSFCACAVENGYVRKNYTVLGHVEDRPASTYCPGQAMLDMIHRWPLL